MSATPATDHDTLLDQVLADYLEAVEAGTAPARSQLLAAHPLLAGDLAAFLDAEARFDSMLAPLATPGTRQPTVLPALQPGERIGAYVIIRMIGHGGMGVVYEAWQDTGADTRRVALKMLRLGNAAHPDDVQRFRLEAAAVAQLDHPNIVPLYEVGDHAGQPYFSMKYIAGAPLARTSTSDARQCARVVAISAWAIQHAHERGILHRDLKPGNVLLDEEGQPHVTDFGLAKRVSSNQRLTQSGLLLGTPSYMAPEQAMGALVTTAVDVWALGAILYELLTGQPPFQTSNALGTLLDVLERDPLPPRLLNPQLPRDLETICLKCLQKEPAHRYGSAAALADDLTRFQNGEPISARPVSSVERLTRWARRQPIVAGLLALVLTLLLGGGVLVASLWLRAEHNLDEALRQKEEAERQRQAALTSSQQKEAARQEAELSYQQARRVLDNLHNRLTDRRLGELPGFQAVRREILAEGLKYYQEFVALHGDDPSLRAEMARTSFRIALLINVIGSKQEALEAYTRALHFFEALERAQPERLEWVRGRAQTLNNLGNLENDLGQRSSAIRLHEQARTLWQTLHEKNKDDLEAASGLASVLANLGGMYKADGAPQRATHYRTQARDMQEQLVALRPQAPEYQSALAHSYFNLGNDALENNQHARGVELLEKAYTIQERLAGKYRDRLWDTSDLAVTCRHLGVELIRTGKAERGQKLLDQAQQLLERLAQSNPAVTDFQADLALLYSSLGAQRMAARQFEAAQAFALEAVEIQTRLLADNPEVQTWRHGLAQSQHNLGNAYRAAGRPCEAAGCFYQARRTYETLLARAPDTVEYQHELGGTLNNMADVMQSLEQWDEAVVLFETAIVHQRQAFAAKPSALHRGYLSSHYYNLARAHRLAQRPENAVEITLQRRDLWPQSPPELLRGCREFLLAAQLVTENATLHERYLQHALETLQRALKAGYRDGQQLRMNPDFAPLRQRPEFEKLLRSLAI